MPRNTVTSPIPPLPQPKLWPNPQVVFAQVLTAPNVLTLTGDIGGPVSADTGGNIDLLGVNTVELIGDPAANTLTVTPRSGGYPITPYVVGPVGKAGYQTIQSAIDAAHTAGGGAIYIQPGTYTENLQLKVGISFVATDANVDQNFVQIVGVHTPDTANGINMFKNINFYGTTQIFASTAAGQAYMGFDTCNWALSGSGYIFDLPNWLGSSGLPTSGDNGIAIVNSGDLSTGNSGFVRNTAGMNMALLFSYIGGYGTTSATPLIASGRFEVVYADIYCPISIQGASNALFSFNTFHGNTLTVGGSSTGTVNNCCFVGLIDACFTMSSSGNWSINNTSIDTSNNPAIAGSGAGTLQIGSITFLNNSTIAGTVTTAYTSRFDTGSLQLNPTLNGPLVANNGLVTSSSPLTIIQGGTGTNAFANVDGTVYYNGTTLATTAVGTSDFVLTSNGAGLAPSYKAIPAMTSPLPIIQGGTNANSMADTDGVVYYDGTRLTTTTVGTSTYVLTSNGTGFAPTFQPAASITSPVPIIQGGTNATSMGTTDGVVYYDGTRLVTTTAGTATYVLTSNGPGVAPTYQPASAVSMTWVTVTGTSQMMAVNTGYVANNAGLITFTLPMTSAVGDTVIVEGLGAGGWTINANGNTIRFGNQSTTGSLSSTNQYDCVTLNCIVANTTWTVRSSVGNLSLGVPLVMQMTFSGNTVGNIGSLLFLKNDGSCWGCGFNSGGVLGNNTTTSYSSPIAAVGGHAFVSISGGANDAIALKSNGTAWGWGTNGNGQLGDLTTTDKSSPVSVVGNHSFIRVVAYNDGGTGAVTVGLKSDGSAWTWGISTNGALGNNTTTDVSSPIQVVGNHSFVFVNGSNFRGMGLKADGSAWMWGDATNGALGNQTITNTSSPVSVVGNHSFVKIAGGNIFTMALKADGSCWGWGNNAVGQLGNQTITNTSSPVAVVGSHSFVDIAPNPAGCHGLKADGSIWSWGGNTAGVIGDQTTTNRSSPVLVVGGFSFSKLMRNAGYYDVGGILANGTVLTWGINDYGQLGNNTRTSYSSPIVVVGLP